MAEEWVRSSEIRLEIELDKWIVMPNHFHGIVIITHDRRGDRPVALRQTTTEPLPTGITTKGQTPLGPTDEQRSYSNKPRGPKPYSLSSFVAGFKFAVTKRVNEIRKTWGLPVWQRNYYEHIIRDETDLKKIREYIQYNPTKWAEDEENPSNLKRATAGRPYREAVADKGRSR